MQYLSCSIKWDYYRHILPLVLTHNTIFDSEGATKPCIFIYRKCVKILENTVIKFVKNDVVHSF